MPSKIFAIVEQPGEQPFRPTFIAHQVREKVIDDVFHPGRTISFETDGLGIIEVPEDEFQAIILKRFEHFKLLPAYANKLVGPFDSREQAHQAQHKLRKKSDAEVAQEVPRLADENSQLKARIAELEKLTNKAPTNKEK